MSKKVLNRFLPVAGLMILSIWLVSPFGYPDGDVLSDSNYYIAHAAGAVDGNTYLNCREGLLQSLANGYKYIELDLGLTADSTLVCIHDWNTFMAITASDTPPP